MLVRKSTYSGEEAPHLHRLAAYRSTDPKSFAAHLVLNCLFVCFLFSTSLFIASLLTGCGPTRRAVVPGFIPHSSSVLPQDEEYGQQVLSQLTIQFPLDEDDSRINRVRDLVDRLTKAAQADRDPWHVYVLKDSTVKNAAATRGNYVFVWSGLLDFVDDDNELAAVVGHEIGHVLAGHVMPSPAEEAREMISGMAGTVTQEVLSRQGGGIGLAAGIAGMIVSEGMKAFIVNPESQRKELEADHIGLFLMADARYDPRAAVHFWSRVQSLPEFGNSSFSVLSSHPSSEERLAQLKALLPRAEERFRRDRRREQKDSFNWKQY